MMKSKVNWIKVGDKKDCGIFYKQGIRKEEKKWGEFVIMVGKKAIKTLWKYKKKNQVRKW